MIRSIVLSALLVSSIATARAETVPNQCRVSWWRSLGGLPLTIEDAPPSPTVFLPLRWEQVQGDTTEPDLTLLTVVATDSADQVVPGSVTMVPVDSTNDAFTTTYVPRWKPAAPLTAGATYTITVDVPAPSNVVEAAQCDYPVIDDEVGVTVRHEAGPPAALELVALETHDAWLTSVGYGPCSGFESPVACPSGSSGCCGYVSPPELQRMMGLGVRATALGAGGDVYHLLTIELRYGPALGTRTIGRTPVTLNELHSESATWTPGSDDPPGATAACVTITLTSLLEDLEVARLEDCADPAEHEAEPAPGDLVCDHDGCDPDVADPDTTPESVEPTAEPGPEPTTEPSDTGSAERSGSSDDDDGCTGGATAGLLSLLVLLARRRK